MKRMRVACPVCWHSVVTAVVCQSCGLIQCLEYEGPTCTACGGPCRPSPAPEEAKAGVDSAPG